MSNTGLVALFNYVFWLLAGKVTSPGHVGLATAAISASMMIAAISRLGMDDSITRFLSHYATSEAHVLSRQYVPVM